MRRPGVGAARRGGFRGIGGSTLLGPSVAISGTRGGTLTAVVTGVPAPTVQWYAAATVGGGGSFSAIAGATSLTFDDSGTSPITSAYDIQCWATNAVTTTASNTLAAWEPASQLTLKLWLKGGALITGNPIDSWGDTAGVAANFANVGTARPPTASENGITVADPDGSNDYLASTSQIGTAIGTNTWEMWAVVNPDALVADGANFYDKPGFMDGGGHNGFSFSASGARCCTNTGSRVQTGYAAVTTCVRQLVRCGYDGAAVHVAVNEGTPVTQATTGTIIGTTGTMRMFTDFSAAAAFFNGKWCDTLAIQSAASTATRNNMLRYMKARWAF